MDDRTLEILFEDNHLLAVSKPAMLPTMGVTPDRASLIAVAKEYVRRRYNKPGNVYLGVVSRLDAPVTGVVLLARTSKAASRLNEQFRARTVEKLYWALVNGQPEPASGECRHWLRKDERHRRMHVAASGQAGVQEAVMQYRVNSPCKAGLTLLSVQLETGRKHQIRVQLAAIGHPVVGDRKYGSRLPFPSGIALHSRRLRLIHPVLKQPIEITAPVPAYWRKFVPASFGR